MVWLIFGAITLLVINDHRLRLRDERERRWEERRSRSRLRRELRRHD